MANIWGTLSYRSLKDLDELERIVKEYNAILVDVRPSHKNCAVQAFTGNKIAEKIGKSNYIHLYALSNVNQYQKHMPVQLVDPNIGSQQLTHVLGLGRSVILFCSCESYKDCHVKFLTEVMLPRYNAGGMGLLELNLEGSKYAKLV